MQKIKFTFGIKEFGVLSALILVFLATRLVNLTLIPIFTDEAIYLRWAQIAVGDPRWRFISLIDGKQPLLIWLMLPAVKYMSDPLVAGRLISIICGIVAMMGFAVFSYYLTRSRKALIIGGLIYILSPFFLLYDRLAIYEALFVAITVWSLTLTYLFGKNWRLDIALILGMAIGAGLLTKSYATFFLLLLPMTLFLSDWNKEKIRKSWKWFGLVGIIVIQAKIYENIMRLSEFRHVIGQKNLSFVYSFNEFFANPFRSVYGNLIGLGSWLLAYITVPFAVLIVVAWIWYLRKSVKSALFFGAYFLGPFLALAFFGKVIYPRFLSFMLVPLFIPVILFVTEQWETSKHKLKIGIIALVVLGPIIYFDTLLLTQPTKAPLPYADKQQFLNDWPAGYGIKEAVAYLGDAAKTEEIWVGTEGTFGLYPMALELYLGQDKNVTFKAYWPLGEVPAELIESASVRPTFLLLKERQEVPSEWPVVLIAQYQRGVGPTYLKFYRVLPQK